MIKKPKTQIILSFIVMLVLGCASDKNTNFEANIATQHSVRTIIAQEQEVTPEIESFGSLSFLKKTDVSPGIDGIVRHIHVEEGDIVPRSRLLVSIENIQIQIRKKQAESGVTSARAALELSTTKYKEGLLQVEARLLSMEKFEIELQQKKVELDDLKQTLKNKEELFKVGGITSEALDSLKLNFMAAQSSYRAMEKDWEIRMIGLRDQDILEKGYKIPQEKTERVNILKIINTQTLKAEENVARANLVSALNELESASQLISELRLKAPMNGIVGAKYLEEGERITSGTKILTLFNTSQVFAVFSVQEEEALLISEGMETVITVDALGQKEYKGKVHLVSPMIDPQSGNVSIKSIFENPDDNFRPGMFLRVKVIYGKPQKTIVIPTTAIAKKKENNGKIFTVVNKRVFQKDVLLGKEDKGSIEVRKGLVQGDIIIDSPSPILREGDEVVIENE